MVSKRDLTRLAPYLYELERDAERGMRVPARIYVDDKLLEAALADRSVEQLANTATLPGIVGHALAMPDVHQGYGFPIGGVAATQTPDGVISPGGVGYDINCGVRLLVSDADAEAARPHMAAVMDALYNEVPAGAGAGGGLRLSESELAAVLEQGARWAVSRGYGDGDDVIHTEDGGGVSPADPATVSERALQRGRDQLGTLGSGNHFLEVDEVVEVYDQEAAAAYGLRLGQLCVWIHCGSRGLGHQVCTDAVRAMQRAMSRYGIALPDRELACAPLSAPEGQSYLRAMNAAANYAWANRQVITQAVRRALERALAGKVRLGDLRVVYDVCHNIAKIEEHELGGQRLRLCVHRKGATRSFGPGWQEVPSRYRQVGQPVLIPGEMRSGSYVLRGTHEAMAATFGSACHGAGRQLSRTQARRSVRGEALRDDLERAHIVVRARSLSGLAEEAPDAYKDLDRVVQIVHEAGLARKVARTRPLGVMKG